MKKKLFPILYYIKKGWGGVGCVLGVEGFLCSTSCQPLNNDGKNQYLHCILTYIRV